MKGFRLCFILLASAALPLVNANAGIMPRQCQFDNKTLETVVCFGPAVINKTTVTSSTQVEGALQGVNATLGSLVIDGPVSLHESIVKGNMRVAGLVSTHRVDVHGEMFVDADSVTLNRSTVVGSVKMSSNDGMMPYLKAQCGTVITGSVTFVGKPGVVQLTDDSDVQGKIVNGELRFVDMKCS